MADRRDHSKTLEQFGGITQYIVGQLDEIAPADLGLQQILLSKVGLFHLIEDCGHMGQWEKPAIILKHFQELLKIIFDKDSKIIFISGPAGTSKTFVAIYGALQLFNMNNERSITYVRTIAESGEKSLGALPGEMAEKINDELMLN